MDVFLSGYLKPADFWRAWNGFRYRNQSGIDAFRIRWFAATFHKMGYSFDGIFFLEMTWNFPGWSPNFTVNR